MGTSGITSLKKPDVRSDFTHTQLRAHTHACVHTDAHSTHTRAHTCTHACTHMCTQDTCTPAHTCTHMRICTCTHRHLHAHRRICACTRTHTRTHQEKPGFPEGLVCFLFTMLTSASSFVLLFWLWRPRAAEANGRLGFGVRGTVWSQAIFLSLQSLHFCHLGRWHSQVSSHGGGPGGHFPLGLLHLYPRGQLCLRPKPCRGGVLPRGSPPVKGPDTVCHWPGPLSKAWVVTFPLSVWSGRTPPRIRVAHKGRRP